jgi:LPS O-antigen subunit length determinant protein (WzzB/FepE family)
MKIGSKIHPRDGKSRDVSVHGTLYVFLPEKDTQQKLHFVADVQNDKDAETFLANSAFYVYTDKPTLTRSAGSKKGADAPTPTPTPSPATAGIDAIEATPEQKAAAQELLKGSLSDIGKAVGSATLSTIRTAIAIETAAETQRQNVVKLLTDTLEFAKAAGTKE